MPVVKAEFDGKVFVPCEPVELLKGALVDVVVPTMPRAFTPEEEQQWQAILQDLASTEPYFPTVEEAINYSRGRPS